jgi:hypothetical protein
MFHRHPLTDPSVRPSGGFSGFGSSPGAGASANRSSSSSSSSSGSRGASSASGSGGGGAPGVGNTGDSGDIIKRVKTSEDYYTILGIGRCETPLISSTFSTLQRAKRKEQRAKGTSHALKECHHSHHHSPHVCAWQGRDRG